MADARSCVGFSSACKQAREGGGLPGYEGGLTPELFNVPRRCWLPPEIVRLIDALVRRLEHEDTLLAMNGGVLGTTLCEAAHAGGHLDVRFLLARGADVETTTVYVHPDGMELNWSALIWAAWFGHLAVCVAILDSGATLLDFAMVNASWNGHTPVVALLLDRGADIHSWNGEALVNAAQEGHLATAKLLLDRGADVHTQHDMPLLQAAARDHLEMVRLLLDCGADLHAEDDRPLRAAAQGGHLEMARLLLDRAADIHADNEFALRVARQEGHAAVEALLLERGALEPQDED